MHQTKKGNQWHFGMKANIGLVHTITTTAANETDVEQVTDLLHGKEQHVWAGSGYRGAHKRVDRQGLRWHIAARQSDIAKLPDSRAKTRLQGKASQGQPACEGRASVSGDQAPVRAGEGSFRGLHKNTAHLLTLFALSNLRMVRRSLMAKQAAVRPQAA